MRIARRFTATVCGHRTPSQGRVEAFGESITTNMPVQQGKVSFCLGCLGKMAIRCAWCGSVIFVGDPVTLYIKPDSMDLLEGAVEYGDDPVCVVGCLGWDCASTGADRAGFWLPDNERRCGHVYRVKSPLEQALETGGVVLVNNVSDISSATLSD